MWWWVLVEVGVARMEKSIHWTCVEDVIVKNKTAQTYDLVAKTGAKNTHKIKTHASCMQGWR